MGRNDGTALEDEVHSMLHSWLASGSIPVNKELCVVHRSKSYYSPRRGSTVHFENVVELFSANAMNTPEPQPSLVLIFECKDYGRNIEIKIVEELIGRTEQDFGFRIKPYLVTKSGFAKTAINAAEARGIGLIKIMEDSKIEHVLYHIVIGQLDRSWNEFPQRVNEALVDPDFIARNESFYGSSDGYVFMDIRSMINKAIKSTFAANS
jgi:hypothetical protein